MTQRSIVLLGVAALILMLVALLFTGTRSSPPTDEAGPLIPGLRQAVNELAALDVVGADGELVAELRRGTRAWHVRNRDDYEADYRRVHDLLRELAEARRAEPRTSLPEWYPRLGVADVGSAEASGIQLEFPGSEFPALILGERDATTGGRYARIAGQEQAWLTDRPLQVPDRALGWLERSVMDIPATELAEVTIVHPDGDRVRLRPADEEGDQWVLLDVPEGRQAAPRWEIRPVANGLANVVFEDVRRHATEVPDDAVRALYVTRDGLNFVVSLFTDEDGRWAHFSVSAEVEATANEESAQPDDDLLADAVAVDARLAPWQYGLGENKFRMMTRRPEDLLEPIGD
ncbi:MAG: DUF4340 domain-containing protein [Wenzhouxiangella sp.]|nr:MAG: DUF4340 domain-containing protein [Wenzhouxiangella sp.]